MNWDKPLHDFRENRCILLLGPRLATVGHNGRQIPLREKLASKLAAALEAEGVDISENERTSIRDKERQQFIFPADARLPAQQPDTRFLRGKIQFPLC